VPLRSFHVFKIPPFALFVVLALFGAAVALVYFDNTPVVSPTPTAVLMNENN
jgi:hypothetical protein